MITKNYNKTMLLTTLILLVSAGISTAADRVSESGFKAARGVVTIVGTSTLHDWEMKSDAVESDAVFSINADGEPEQLESVIFRLKKTTLKSDRSGLDRRAYDALDAKRHPEIVFRTDNDARLQQSGENYHVETTGELTIAGVTRQIEVNTTCVNGDETRLICSGSQKLNMSDFDIDPPVLMLGTLRTGDEITINYEIVYTR
jgi:polyisoprenoid-binding protein YceI